jgi:hypothetical protein
MVKRDFSAWDFVKQEPKKRGFTILDGTAGTLITDYPNVVMGGGDWVVDTTAGTNNIVFGSNMTISADVSDTVFISNLSVAGSAEIPPSEGQLRYNTVNGTTEAYVDGEWIELGPVTQYPLPRKPKISKRKYLNPLYWFDIFVNFMENRA